MQVRNKIDAQSGKKRVIWNLRALEYTAKYVLYECTKYFHFWHVKYYICFLDHC